MNLHAVMPAPNPPGRTSKWDGYPGVAARDQPQGMWFYLCHPIAVWPWESHVNDKVLMTGPEAKFLNIDA